MPNIIDTRDLIERMSELEADEADLDEDERDELAAIRELAESGIEDWQYGAQLIPVRDFQEYARELAEDIGAIPPDNGWPCYCIDWEWAARELAMDYTLVTFQGVDYYVR